MDDVEVSGDEGDGFALAAGMANLPRIRQFPGAIVMIVQSRNLPKTPSWMVCN
jgi:hypothetical protein